MAIVTREVTRPYTFVSDCNGDFSHFLYSVCLSLKRGRTLRVTGRVFLFAILWDGITILFMYSPCGNKSYVVDIIDVFLCIPLFQPTHVATCALPNHATLILSLYCLISRVYLKDLKQKTAFGAIVEKGKLEISWYSLIAVDGLACICLIPIENNYSLVLKICINKIQTVGKVTKTLNNWWQLRWEERQDAGNSRNDHLQ